jgi:hypothetical protein
MKKLITILCAGLLTFGLSAQQVDKGTLLLEGKLDGTAWTGLATNGGSFGMYLADGFALTTGYVIGIVEDETLVMSLGARIHFTESQLLKINLAYDDGSEDVSAYLGFANRFYYKDWMSIEPQAGIAYAGEALVLATGVGFNLHFQR